MRTILRKRGAGALRSLGLPRALFAQKLPDSISGRKARVEKIRERHFECENFICKKIENGAVWAEKFDFSNLLFLMLGSFRISSRRSKFTGLYCRPFAGLMFRFKRSLLYFLYVEVKNVVAFFLLLNIWASLSSNFKDTQWCLFL